MSTSVKNNTDFGSAFDEAVSGNTATAQPPPKKGAIKLTPKSTNDFSSAFDEALKKKDGGDISSDGTSQSDSQSPSPEDINAASLNYQNKTLKPDDVKTLAQTDFGQSKGFFKLTDATDYSHFADVHNTTPTPDEVDSKVNDFVNNYLPDINPIDTKKFAAQQFSGQVTKQAQQNNISDVAQNKIPLPAGLSKGDAQPVIYTDEAAANDANVKAKAQMADGIKSGNIQQIATFRNLSTKKIDDQIAEINNNPQASVLGGISSAGISNTQTQLSDAQQQQVKALEKQKEDIQNTLNNYVDKTLVQQAYKKVGGLRSSDNLLSIGKQKTMYEEPTTQYDAEQEITNSLAKTYQNYQDKQKGIDAALNAVSMDYAANQKLTLSDADVNAKDRLKDNADLINDLVATKANLPNEYLPVQVNYVARLMGDKISSFHPVMNMFITDGDRQKAIEELDKENPGFSQKYSTAIKYIQDNGGIETNIPHQGFIGAFNRGGTEGVQDVMNSVKDFFGARSKGDRSADDLINSYSAYGQGTSFAGQTPDKIVVDKEGLAFKQLPNENYGKTNFNTVFNGLGQFTGGLVPYALLTEGVGDVAKLATTAAKVPLSAALQSRIGVTGATYLMNYDNNLKQADKLIADQTDSGDFDRGMVANLLTLGQAAAFTILPANEFVRNNFTSNLAKDASSFLEGNSLKQGIDKDALNTWLNDIVKPRTLASLKVAGVDAAKNVGKLDAEMLLQNHSNAIINSLFDKTGATKNNDVVQQDIQTLKDATLGGLFMALPKLATSSFAMTARDALYDNAQHADENIARINDLVSAGKMDAEQGNGIIKLINTASNNLKNLSAENEKGVPTSLRQRKIQLAELVRKDALTELKKENDNPEIETAIKGADENIKTTLNNIPYQDVSELPIMKELDKNYGIKNPLDIDPTKQYKIGEENLSGDNILSQIQTSQNESIKTENGRENVSSQEASSEKQNNQGVVGNISERQGQPSQKVESNGAVSKESAPNFDGLSHPQSAAKLLDLGIIDEAKHSELVKALNSDNEVEKDAAIKFIQDEKQKAEIPVRQDNEAGNSSDGLKPTEEGITSSTEANKVEQGTQENGITVIKPEENNPNKNITTIGEGKQQTPIAQAAISKQDFHENVLKMAEGMKDSNFDWRLTIPEMSQKDREKAVADIRAGKESVQAKKLQSYIDNAYEKNVITLNRGRGNQAQTVDFPLKEWFGEPLTHEELKHAETFDDNSTQIINDEGITSENIDNLKHLFNGFPYDNKDFEQVKSNLAGQDKSSTENKSISSPEQRKEAISKLTPEQRQEYLQAHLNGKGDEYLQGKSKKSDADISNGALKDDKNVGEYTAKAKAVLEQLYPNAKLETYDNTEDYIKAGGEKGTRGVSIADKDSNHRVLLNLEQIKKDNSGKTAFHEVIHPIVYDAFGVKAEQLTPIWNEIASTMKDVKGFDKVLEHISSYDVNDVPKEGITEALTQIAAGNIDLKDVPKSSANKIIDVINRLFEALGIDYKINSVNDFGELASKIKNAFDTSNASDLKDVIKSKNIDKYITDLEKKLSDKDLSPKEFNDRVNELKDLGFTDDEIKAALQKRNLSDEQINKILPQSKTETDAVQKQATTESVLRDEGVQRESGLSKVEQNDKSKNVTQESSQKEKIDSEGNNVGVSHARLTELAQKLGLTEPERGQYLSPESYADRGRQLLKAGADPNEVNNPNNELHDRIAIARAHLEDLVKNADTIAKEKGIDSDEYREAIEQVDKYGNDVVKKLGTLAHRAFTSLQGERDVDTDSFTAVKRSFEDSSGKKPSAEQEKKIKELTETNQKLKQQADDLEKKLVEATNENIGKEPSKKTYSQKAKNVADRFRKLKTKPFTFKDENGNDIPIQIQGATWNDLVELGAKAIEKTGEIADGVLAIIDKIKDSEVYQKLSDADKIKLEQQLTSHYESAVEETPEAKTIKRLQKQLDDLHNGIVKGKTEPFEDTPAIKDLKDKIHDAKKDLGLISSKKTESKAHELEITAAEKKIERFQKEKEDLENGIVKQNKVSSVETTPEQKATIEKLTEDIGNLKKNLGVLKSKAEKPLTEQEQKQADEKELSELQKQFVDKSDNKFTIDEAKTIWDYAKKNYIDKGVSYKDMISNVANDLGLSWRQVSDAITTPKIKRISDAMWKKQADYRRNQLATKNWIDDQEKSAAGKLLKKVSGAFRGIAVFGHGGIFIGTHAGMTLFQPSTWNKTIPAFFRGWKYAYGNVGEYERSIESLKNRDNYVLAQRAGLKNNPERLSGEEYQKSQKYLGKLGLAGERGFNAIKVLRQDLFDYHYSKLTDAEKAEPESAESIARLVNLATGATNLNIPEWVNELTFAGGMEATRWGKLIKSPVQATATALKALFAPSKATVQERVFAKVWARRVGEQLATFTGLLLANAAIQNTLNPNNPTNLTNPDKPDYLKFKFGDLTLDPTSGMRSVGMFIYGLGKIPFEEQKQLKGDTRVVAAGKQTFGYGRGKLAPLYATLADFYGGRDFSRNPLPFSNDKPSLGHHKLTWGEYAWEKAPLPISEAATVTYQSAVNDGANKPTLNNILNGIVSGAISGTTGFRVGEYNAEEANHSPFNSKDKKDPTFKYFLDKGLELPNTSLNSVKIDYINDKGEAQSRHVSDYPKEIQQKYQDEHKTQLKNELDRVQNQKFVFVTTSTNADGSKDKSVSIDFPSHGNFEMVDINKLSKEELAQVLSIAQKQATKNAKAVVFPNYGNQ